MKKLIFLVLVLLIVGAAWYGRDFISGVAPIVLPSPSINEGQRLPFSVPDGFTATLFATSTPGARVIVRDPLGTIVVSLTSAGSVIALPDKDGNGVTEGPLEIVGGLHSPHGIVFWCAPTDPERCLLYIAEEERVRSYVYDSDSKSARLVGTVADLPSGGGHKTRSLQITPDGEHLLISIGSSCNVCIEGDERRASILSYDIYGHIVSPFAKGLRNTVFMAIDPVDGKIWGADMGRDLLGDDIPPDEINILKNDGNFGWPICYGKNIHDTNFDKNTYIRNPCMEPFEAPSHIDIPAHAAPLGLAFIPEEGWPDNYGLDLLVAYHGSWNRSTPTGYKIVRIELDFKRNPTGEVVDFMTGFMNESGQVVGKPVGLLVEPGGTVYVTDDRAGAVYKISRTSSE